MFLLVNPVCLLMRLWVPPHTCRLLLRQLRLTLQPWDKHSSLKQYEGNKHAYCHQSFWKWLEYYFLDLCSLIINKYCLSLWLLVWLNTALIILSKGRIGVNYRFLTNLFGSFCMCIENIFFSSLKVIFFTQLDQIACHRSDAWIVANFKHTYVLLFRYLTPIRSRN